MSIIELKDLNVCDLVEVDSKLKSTFYLSDGGVFYKSVKKFKYSLIAYNQIDQYVVYIDKYANNIYNNVVKAVIPEGVTHIDADLCNINELVIPKSAKYVRFNMETLLNIPESFDESPTLLTFY